MENMKFEKSMEQLEKIVTELEGGNLPLEEALQKYEKGITLSKLCNKKLSEVEKKVEILMKKSGGEFETQSFEPDQAEQQTGKGKKPRTKKKNPVKEPLNDDDLFLS